MPVDEEEQSQQRHWDLGLEGHEDESRDELVLARRGL